MRAATGRDRILKVEGGYHGHHDSVEVSVLPEPDDDIGPADRPTNVADNTGIPTAIMDLVTIVPFNDLDAVERALAEHPGEVAGMLVEPVMMNAGIIHPLDGYLAGLKDLLHRHGALLAFDEVKTGLTTGPGGVTRLSGVTPDLVCLAKAMGGGVSTAAIGGTERVMALVADGTYQQVGTFNGNPLAMAAARAMLTEVLTPAAYAHLDRLRDRMSAGLQDVIDRHLVAEGLRQAGQRDGARHRAPVDRAVIGRSGWRAARRGERSSRRSGRCPPRCAARRSAIARPCPTGAGRRHGSPARASAPGRSGRRARGSRGSS
jgi:glutamate-1-semialdehyde 2,1-aminomutase